MAQTLGSRRVPLIVGAVTASLLVGCGHPSESTALERVDSGSNMTLCLPSPPADGLTTFSEIAVRNRLDRPVELTTVDTGNPALTVVDSYVFPLAGTLPGSGMPWRPPARASRTVPAGETVGVNLRLRMVGPTPVEGEGFTMHFRTGGDTDGAVVAGTNYRILGVGRRDTC